MKIIVIGLRGFPNIQGGVETHCEKLYPRFVKKGCEVIVFGRTPYLGKDIIEFQGVKIKPVFTIKNKYFEAVFHTFLCVFIAAKMNPDIVHFHGVGQGLMIPLAKLFGLKIVFTHHGRDYERKKWGNFSKNMLKIGESLACRFSDKIICIADYIADAVKKSFNKESAVIPNGVDIPLKIENKDILSKYGLESKKYILALGRFVPEKGFHDLIKAFGNISKQELNDFKLVIAGDADHEDEYSLNLKKQAGKYDNIILTSFLTGQDLSEIYSHAGLFILPSYYEGLPLVLLEAMSYGLSCVVSDIPANRCVKMSNERFFNPGDIKTLSEKIKKYLNNPMTETEINNQILFIKNNYNWNDIADQVSELYSSL